MFSDVRNKTTFQLRPVYHSNVVGLNSVVPLYMTAHVVGPGPHGMHSHSCTCTVPAFHVHVLTLCAIFQLVVRPDVVEMHDVTARDPKLLVHLKVRYLISGFSFLGSPETDL